MNQVAAYIQAIQNLKEYEESLRTHGAKVIETLIAKLLEACKKGETTSHIYLASHLPDPMKSALKRGDDFKRWHKVLKYLTEEYKTFNLRFCSVDDDDYDYRITITIKNLE